MSRVPLPLPRPRLRRSLERLASRIEDPATKLWFIKTTLEKFHRKPTTFRETPLVRGLVLYYDALETFAELSQRPDSRSFRPGSILILYRIRYLIAAACVAGTAGLTYFVAPLGYQRVSKTYDFLAGLYLPMVTPPATASAGSRLRLPDYPDSRLSPVPREIWLVETEREEELWSNGLRVVTTFESRTHERDYLFFLRDETLGVQQNKAPIGIVYHTSENDFAPFQSGFNREILKTTRGLLRWLHKRDFYNYFIDRFGQVYRLVIDAHTASHAGMSVWANEDHYYLNLSEGFLGVCFESQWDPEAAGEQILTPAQIQAALNLTDMLRARYQITDSNCVPHGLVSVNPKRMLIGYHVDWAKGFPFAALGLSDKYDVPLPSMLEFGFNYDENLVKTLNGDLWPGIRRAQVELARKAEQQDLPLDALQKKNRRRYRQQMELLKLAGMEKERKTASASRSGSSQP